MVFIGAAQQQRLVEVARRLFGPDGEAVVRNAARLAFDLPLEQVTYAQLPALFTTIERDAAAARAQSISVALAAALRELQQDITAGLGGRLIGAVSRRMGPMAEPFLINVCTRAGITVETIDRQELPRLAAVVRIEAEPLLGADVAERLASAVLEAGSARPAGMVTAIVALAKDHLGTDGEANIRRMCREGLEVELEELDIDSVAMLALAVAQHGPALIAGLGGGFAAAARQTIASPAEPLRRRLVELITQRVGPAGPEFLRTVCTQNGLPFEAVDYEHLMWLAEVVRREAAPLAGKNEADVLARGLRSVLTGMK